MLVPLGARAAASRTAAMSARGTGVGKKRRTDRREVIAWSTKADSDITRGPRVLRRFSFRQSSGIPTRRNVAVAGGDALDGTRFLVPRFHARRAWKMVQIRRMGPQIGVEVS